MNLFHTQLKLHIRLVGSMYQTSVSQVSFLLFCFLSEDVTFESVLSFDLPTTSYRESLLGTGFCLHFWHFLASLNYYTILFYFFFGFTMMIIRFPSNFGICSMVPKSDNS